MPINGDAVIPVTNSVVALHSSLLLFRPLSCDANDANNVIAIDEFCQVLELVLMTNLKPVGVFASAWIVHP